MLYGLVKAGANEHERMIQREFLLHYGVPEENISQVFPESIGREDILVVVRISDLSNSKPGFFSTIKALQSSGAQLVSITEHAVGDNNDFFFSVCNSIGGLRDDPDDEPANNLDEAVTLYREGIRLHEIERRTGLSGARILRATYKQGLERR